MNGKKLSKILEYYYKIGIDMNNILISYDHKDQNIIEKIEPELRKHGVIGDEPYKIIDPFKDIKQGENVREKLLYQMRSANLVVFLVTNNTASSTWVNYEAGIAHALDKNILLLFGKKGEGKSSFTKSLSNFSQNKYFEIDM
jgi:hypothetical protein